MSQRNRAGLAGVEPRVRWRYRTLAIGLAAAALTLCGELTVDAVAIGSVHHASDRGSSGRLAQQTESEGCAELIAMFDAQHSFYAASLNDDADAATDVLGGLAAIADAAVAAAPDEISDAVAAWVRPWQTADADLAGLDLIDAQTVFATISRATPWFAVAADTSDVIVDQLGRVCGYAVDDAFLVPEAPAPCEELDASTAADAAGIVLDSRDADGTFTQAGPGVSWKLCTYDRGSVSLYTMSFNSLDVAVQLVTEGAVDWGGDIVDADVGALPDSTLLTRLMGATTVTVFEAPVPFAVQLAGSGIAPGDVIDAAEQLLAIQDATASTQPSSTPTTT